jgi:hypothetical protein
MRISGGYQQIRRRGFKITYLWPSDSGIWTTDLYHLIQSLDAAALLYHGRLIRCRIIDYICESSHKSQNVGLKEAPNYVALLLFGLLIGS